jgi:uncharacterized protein
MSLKQKIEQDLKAAMLARNEVGRDTLRMVLASVRKLELEAGRDATEDEVLGVLKHAAKTRQDSVEQFEKAGRLDLSQRESAQIAVIRGYLPQQMAEPELREAVRALVAELGLSSKKDLGTLMKALMARYKGAVDGKLAQKLAGEFLP